MSSCSRSTNQSSLPRGAQPFPGPPTAYRARALSMHGSKTDSACPQGGCSLVATLICKNQLSFSGPINSEHHPFAVIALFGFSPLKRNTSGLVLPSNLHNVIEKQLLETQRGSCHFPPALLGSLPFRSNAKSEGSATRTVD